MGGNVNAKLPLGNLQKRRGSSPRLLLQLFNRLSQSYPLRFRRLGSSSFFRNLIDFGVTSTSSSSSMNSSACSRVRLRGGVSLMASSVPEARTLVSFFPLQGLTSRSLSLECWPMIIPP